MGVYDITYMWRSENNFMDLVLAFYHVVHGIEVRSPGSNNYLEDTPWGISKMISREL